MYNHRLNSILANLLKHLFIILLPNAAFGIKNDKARHN